MGSWGRCSLGNPLHPATCCSLSGVFFPGCRALARREGDGFYYLGTVIQQVQDRTGVWVVEFDHPGGATLCVVPSQRQLVCSLDMVNHFRDHPHCLAPGDAVLSPWEPNLRRYGPGRVMVAADHRGDGIRSLRVLMWNGCVSLVPDRLVSPISACHYDIIVRELQIRAAAPSPCCSWLCARGPSCPPWPFCTGCSPSTSYCCCCPVTNRRPRVPPSRCRSSLGGADGSVGSERAHRRDLEERESGPEVPSSSSSSLSEDEVSVAFPPTVTLRSEQQQQRPPWRYWRRTGPEPHHRQPGSAAPRMSRQPARFGLPVPQASASPNHSSLFQSLPAAKGRRANIWDVFGTTSFKPRPPVGRRPFTANNATTVYMSDYRTACL